MEDQGDIARQVQTIEPSVEMPSRVIRRSEGRRPALWPSSLTIPAKRVVWRANGTARSGRRSLSGKIPQRSRVATVA
jgi:hypothetical protein